MTIVTAQIGAEHKRQEGGQTAAKKPLQRKSSVSAWVLELCSAVSDLGVLSKRLEVEAKMMVEMQCLWR
jgi:hypothetical protein